MIEILIFSAGVVFFGWFLGKAEVHKSEHPPLRTRKDTEARVIKGLCKLPGTWKGE